MRKCLRVVLLLLMAHTSFLITGCGFEPVYGVNRNMAVGVESRLENVAIGNIPDRSGQYLRNALIDRFYRGGYPQNPAYELTIGSLSEDASDLDVTKSSEATRGQMRIDANMILKDIRTGKVVLDRKIRASASYNIVGSQFANRVTQDNARENTLNDLARQVETQLNLYFRR